MKTNSLFYILIILGSLLSSCTVETIHVDGNDYVVAKNAPISNFSAIEIAAGFNAYVTFSNDEESIVIEANENLHPYIIVSYDDNILNVRLKNNINIKGPKTLNVYIKTASISGFKAFADASITLETPLEANHAEIRLSADSFFSGELDVNHLEYNGAADTRADLYGKVNFLDANLSADSKISDYDLEVNDLKMKMFADCKAYLTVTGTIDLDAVADCALYYKGGATVVKQHLAADSRIVKVD